MIRRVDSGDRQKEADRHNTCWNREDGQSEEAATSNFKLVTWGREAHLDSATREREGEGVVDKSPFEKPFSNCSVHPCTFLSLHRSPPPPDVTVHRLEVRHSQTA